MNVCGNENSNIPVESAIFCAPTKIISPILKNIIHSTLPSLQLEVDGGFYADPDIRCQVFHICAADGEGGLIKYSFLCPVGSIFHQQYFICDWYFNVDCSQAESLYSLNDQLAAEREKHIGAVEGSGGGYVAPGGGKSDEDEYEYEYESRRTGRTGRG